MFLCRSSHMYSDLILHFIHPSLGIVFHFLQFLVILLMHKHKHRILQKHFDDICYLHLSLERKHIWSLVSHVLMTLHSRNRSYSLPGLDQISMNTASFYEIKYCVILQHLIYNLRFYRIKSHLNNDNSILDNYITHYKMNLVIMQFYILFIHI